MANYKILPSKYTHQTQTLDSQTASVSDWRIHTDTSVMLHATCSGSDVHTQRDTEPREFREECGRVYLSKPSSSHCWKRKERKGVKRKRRETVISLISVIWEKPHTHQQQTDRNKSKTLKLSAFLHFFLYHFYKRGRHLTPKYGYVGTHIYSEFEQF